MRYVDDRVATIWLQADAACEVEVLGVRERTWCVEGLHFALVAARGACAVGEDHPYEVRLDGELVWPEPGSAFPASTIRLLDARGRREVVFGSCRTTRPHEPPYVLRASEHEAGRASTRCARTRCVWRAPAAARLPGHAADARRPGLRRSALAGVAGGAGGGSARPTSQATSWPTSASTRWPTARRGRSRRSAGCSRRCR